MIVDNRDRTDKTWQLGGELSYIHMWIQSQFCDYPNLASILEKSLRALELCVILLLALPCLVCLTDQSW